jgi:hypothetical protein
MGDPVECLRKKAFGCFATFGMSATREEKPLKDANPTSATRLKDVWEASERTKHREVEKT